MFRSLANRNYRLFATGQVISLSGTWAQRVAQDWLVLLIVPKEQAAVALGITTALQFLPMLLFGLYGGVLADRYDKRRLLIGAQLAMGVLALVLGVLDLTGVVALWHVYLLAFGLGLASVVDTPARQSFVSELVGTDDLPNAVSLNSATFNSARIVGPALAGLAISGVGTGWVFIANALTYVAVLAVPDPDADVGAPASPAAAAAARPAARGRAARAAAARALRADPAGLHDRDVRTQLPADPGADREADVPHRCRLVRAAHVSAGTSDHCSGPWPAPVARACPATARCCSPPWPSASSRWPTASRPRS